MSLLTILYWVTLQLFQFRSGGNQDPMLHETWNFFGYYPNYCKENGIIPQSFKVGYSRTNSLEINLFIRSWYSFGWNIKDNVTWLLRTFRKLITTFHPKLFQFYFIWDTLLQFPDLCIAVPTKSNGISALWRSCHVRRTNHSFQKDRLSSPYFSKCMSLWHHNDRHLTRSPSGKSISANWCRIAKN